MRFRVKQGIHIGGSKTFRKGQRVDRDVEVVDKDGDTVQMKAGDTVELEKVKTPSKWYRAASVPGYSPGEDIIETDVDLVHKHGAEKYERLSDTPSPDEPAMQRRARGPDFERMTPEQLKEYAEANEIDLQHTGKKEDMVKVIREAYETPSPEAKAASAPVKGSKKA